jgi:hypothetical protein
MITCGVFTGILFSRKACGQPAAINCGRCNMPVCQLHLRPQASGPFLCPSCDSYEHDDDWDYSDGGWRYRSHHRDDDTVATASAADLTDDDKPGFATGASGTWDGPGSPSSEESGDEGSDFDAS